MDESPISDIAFIDLDAPTVAAWEYRTGNVVSWLVWCKHCRKWHRHGAMEGHHWAHCTELTSPYHATGYNLALRGEWHEAFASES